MLSDHKPDPYRKLRRKPTVPRRGVRLAVTVAPIQAVTDGW
jgi:hypothetical protein